MSHLFNDDWLLNENIAYAGTFGVSQHNGLAGFLPAFHDTETGRIELSRFADGTPSPIHLLDGLPDDWIIHKSAQGHVTAIKRSVVAGFLFNGSFLTREQAARYRVH